MGRPSKYTPEIIAEICERLSNGEPLAAICRDPHIPDQSTVWDWSKEREDVSQAIARAREVGEDVIAAQVLEIIDRPAERVATKFGDQVDSGDVANRKLRAEYRLKLLAKWNPKRWGDRIDMTTNGKELPPQTVHITREVIGRNE